MIIHHIALGGCLTAPHVNYGITEDTGGHIAYVLGAATAQADRRDVTAISLITRAFDAPELGADHALTNQKITDKISITRLRTDNPDYLTKEALDAEIVHLQRAYIAYLDQCDQRPDIIHAHFADAARLASAARDRFGIPFVYTPHSLGLAKSSSNCAPSRIRAERAALRNADATVLSSRDEAECQVAAYGPGLEARVHTVPPGVTVSAAADPDDALPLLQDHLDDPHRPTILAIARPVARKNLATLAQVYAADPDLQSRANLVILAGQHDQARRDNVECRAQIAALQAIATAPDLKGRIALPPSHTPADVPALYAHAARTGGIFVNVALHEPFGLTLLEAAAHGLPVIATDQGGPADIVATLGNGLCVPPRDHAAIGDAIHRLINDPAAWAEHASAGHAGIGQFDWAVWADQVAGIYADIMAPATRSAPMGLLASDIDGTLTGDHAACARFADWHVRSNHAFAVATGRSISQARRILRQWGLPVPMAFITSVGSEVYRRQDNGQIALDPGYAALMDACWDRAQVMQAVQSFGLDLQHHVEQRRWKISGFGNAQRAEGLRAYLKQQGIAARIIHSHDRLIDILPINGGKAAAVSWLADSLQVPPSRVIVAGDSGNDVDMLQMPDIGHAIVVANAQAELLAHLHDTAVIRATRPYADGVLQGMAIATDAANHAMMAAE